ncbi:Zn-ribbon domain-containing OB-fold protein [Acidisphaera sp. S103]|uniref:Zn-ribbon domain-containing OB-fold protein n=1 Tax=Acidisphaera sp. S103 TaxID=1747223 RepID=UPI00131C3E9F|nr:OB-fold domain-containing protein [Acidisphaera sp. S103]
MARSRAVMSIYDQPMWKSIDAGKWQLQQCDGCGAYRYPPGPVCDKCLSMDSTWRDLSGRGKVLSWVVFHRKYLSDYEPPYNAVAVQLAEGPIVVTNLIGPEPEGGWIGRDVEICYEPDAEGHTIPRVKLAN